MKDFSVEGYWNLPSVGECILPSFTLSKVSFWTGFRRSGIYNKSTFANYVGIIEQTATHDESEVNLLLDELIEAMLTREYRYGIPVFSASHIYHEHELEEKRRLICSSLGVPARYIEPSAPESAFEHERPIDRPLLKSQFSYFGVDFGERPLNKVPENFFKKMLDKYE